MLDTKIQTPWHWELSTRQSLEPLLPMKDPFNLRESRDWQASPRHKVDPETQIHKKPMFAPQWFHTWKGKLKSDRRREREFECLAIWVAGKCQLGSNQGPNISACLGLILSFCTLGWKNMPRWFQRKPQIPVLMKEAIFILNYVCKRLGVDYKKAGKAKRHGDVIWSRSILHNRIFSFVGHCGEWHFKRAPLKQKAIKWSEIIKLENALDKTQ